MYFRDYGFAKMRFDKYLKSVVLQYPWTNNMVKTLKHIRNLQGSTIIILVHH